MVYIGESQISMIVAERQSRYRAQADHARLVSTARYHSDGAGDRSRSSVLGNVARRLRPRRTEPATVTPEVAITPQATAVQPASGGFEPAAVDLTGLVVTPTKEPVALP